MKFVVTGGSGFLGYKIARHLCKNNKVFASYNKNFIKDSNINFFHMDITNEREIGKNISQINPMCVVHAGAIADVDYCERNKELAWEVNVVGTKNIINICEKIKARLIFISTDLVFDGSKKYYMENDNPNPINFYGKTKYEGEKLVRNSGLSYAIIRLSLLYGWNRKNQKKNIATFILENLMNKRELKMPVDRFNTPILINDVPKFVEQLSFFPKSDLYHLAGPELVNRYQFASKVAEIFNLKQNLISPTERNNSQIIKRQKYAGLDSKKILGTLNMEVKKVEEGLKYMKSNKL